MKQKLNFLTVLSLMTILLSLLLIGCSSASVPVITPSPTPEIPTNQANNPIPSSTPAPNNSLNPTPPPINSTNNGTAGILADIQGNVLVLTIGQGTVTVTVASDTTVQETTTGTPSDFQPGQFLTVIGTPDANNNIVATSISIEPQRQGLFNNQPPNTGSTPNPNRTPLPSDNRTRPGGFSPYAGENITGINSFGRGTSGNLTSIDGDTLILSDTQGTVTVILNSDTTIQKTITVAIPDLKIGQFLNVIGSKDANGNILATSIMVQNQRPGGRIPVPGASQ